MPYSGKVNITGSLGKFALAGNCKSYAERTYRDQSCKAIAANSPLTGVAALPILI